MVNIEKKVINKAMKDFRKTQTMAKNEGLEINSIFYLGERLTPLQIDLLKEAIYSVSELNKTIGKDKADELIRGIISEVMVEMFLSELMK